jgi:3-phosphoshikimate 1-carboxyvinyltransferase
VQSELQQDEEMAILKIHGGGIRGGETSISGNISSQFISGLLFACPKSEKDVRINVTTPLESRSYVQMTMEVLRKHGIKVQVERNFTRFRVASNQKYRVHNHETPGDFSSAAFLLAAAAITSSKVKVKNLDSHTSQGDKAILDLLRQMGSNIVTFDKCVELKSGRLEAITVDARDTPDLVPVCAALACFSQGTYKVNNAKRLRYKESDRLSSLDAELKKMGARIKVDGESLTVDGPCPMRGAIIDSHNDHRIAMACTVVALGSDGATTIQSSECVKKSYPKFFEDLHSLGANIFGWQLDR